MAGYIRLPITTDPDTLSEEALDTLATSIPGYVPRDGHLSTWMVLVWSRLLAENRSVASSVADSVFRYFGDSMVGVAPIEAVAATVPSTWTMIDTAGYTVEAGTLVGLRVAGDVLIPFEVVTTFTIAPGASATAAGAVTLRALEAGTKNNGIAAGEAELIDALAFVQSVTTTAATSGGVNAEADDDYLARLRSELQLMSPRPIRAVDFPILARRVANVHRALAIDNYNPADGTFNNERMVTVAVVDADGNPLSTATKDEVDALLEAERELNFIVHVIDPTYTTVNIAFTITTRPEYVATEVLAEAIAAVQNFISPAVWGGGDEVPPVWRTTEGVVRYLEVASAIYRVPGVDDVTALTLNGASADVNLTGVAPLPAANSTVTGTLA